MSGSGGGGGGFVPADEIACDKLRFETQIATPSSAGIAVLNVGDILSVIVQAVSGQQVVAIYKGGTLIGGLAGGQVPRLRDCIGAGTTYDATVLSINGPKVMVRIEPV